MKLSLPIEDRYEVATAFIGGALYLVIGACMAARAMQWPKVAFALMNRTQERAIRFETPKNLRFVRILGACFVLLATMMLYIGAEHYRWIKNIEAYDATHPLITQGQQ
jgi:hypothetical protein